MHGTATVKGSGRVESAESQAERAHRKLQRILRAPGAESPHLSGAVSRTDPKRMSEERKAATLAPRLVNPASVPQDDSPLFQCTECDMIVKESDPYCPFCGAIFADAPAPEEPQEIEVAVERPQEAEMPVERPAHREPMARPEKFDIFSLVGRSEPKTKDMLYREALKGFTGSARLLEEIERLVSDIGALGTDTMKARRLIGSAWEACRDGDWNLVSMLARQTEEIVAPSIPDLVRGEIAKARSYLTEAKALGVDISPYILKIKMAMQSLRADDQDEALRVTKELMDAMREDSISWK